MTRASEMHQPPRHAGGALRWMIGAIAVMAAAVPLTSAAIRLAGLERSTWLRVVADGATQAPVLRVVYRDGSEAPLPVHWEAAAPSTMLGLNATAPVRLLAIDTDRGLVPPWLVQTWGTRWERVTDPPSLLVDGPGIIDAAGAFRRFTLTFETSPATVDIGWLDQHQTISLSQHPGASASVTLTRPPQHVGWALLPPIAIDRLSLEAGSRDAFVVREVTLHAPTAQTLRPAADTSGGSAPPCGVVLTQGPARVEPAAEGPCRMRLEGLTPFNQASPAVRILTWTLVTASGLALLWLVAAGARCLDRLSAGHELVETRAGRWLRERTTRWTLPAVLAAVTAVTVVYHVTYVLSVPPHFNFDSLGYYAFGRNLLHTRSLDAIATCRTPGYPAVIALSILLFGDGVQPLIVAQHLALCLLGAAVVVFLYSRAGPLFAAVGGLLAGVSPILSIMANMLWTETLFAVISALALLVFVHAGRSRPFALVSAGMLAGVATLIRPNGVVIAALMVLWVFLRWWGDPSRGARLSRLALPAGLVLAGFLAVTSIWLVHFQRTAGHWGVSDANCAQEGQTHTLAAGLQPTNIFQLAGFVNLMSQSDRIQTLAVARPYRVFFEFFPARHRYYVERFLPWDLTYDERMPGELFREYVRRFPGTYLRQVGDALLFNTTRITRPRPSIFHYPDVEAVLTFQQTRHDAIAATPDPRADRIAQTRIITWADAQVLLAWMTSEWKPSLAPLRSLHLWINGMAMASWGAIVLLGLVSSLFCVILAAYRSCLVLVWHALVLALAPAILAMGADRYAMVGEPAWYILIALLLSFALGCRVRRRELVS